MRYTNTGGVIPRGIPTSQRNNGGEHKTMFGLYRGVIVKVIYPDNRENSNGSRIEYVVKIRGQEYPNAIMMKDLGGVFDYHETVLKGSEKSFSGPLGHSSADHNMDGSHVYVMFLEGFGNIPIIVGGADHPRRPSSSTKDDGVFDTRSFNGVVFSVDSESNFSISQTGRKDPEGVVENPDAVGSTLTIGGTDGDFSVETPLGAFMRLLPDGSVKLMTSDGSMLFMDSNDGSVKMMSKDNHIITMDANGIKITHKDGHEIDMAADITLKHKGGSTKIVMKNDEVDVDSTKVNLGTSASKKVALEDLVAQIFDTHIHPTAMGPSGPSTTPMANQIGSANVKAVP